MTRIELLKSSRASWEHNIKEDAETKVASHDYKVKYEEVEELFKRHRDQVRIFLRKNPNHLNKLGVTGSFPTQFNDFFDKVELFYKEIKNNHEIQQDLSRIRITAELADSHLASLDELRLLRSKYDSEASESQDATKSKNATIIEFKEWMDDFYDIAQIALYDKPQLLEALGIFVRS